MVTLTKPPEPEELSNEHVTFVAKFNVCTTT